MSDTERDDQAPRQNAAEKYLETLGQEPEATNVLHVPEVIPVQPGAADASAQGDGTMDDTPLEGSDAEAYAALKRRRAERRRKKLIRRGIIAGVAVGVLALSALAISIMNQQPEQTMEPIVDVPIQGTFTNQIDASGTLQPLSSTIVTPEVDGQIATVNVSAGQTVKKGDVLFTIKNDELDRAVSQAERELKNARSALAAAKRGETVVDPVTGEETVTVSQDAIDSAAVGVETAQVAYDAAVAQAAKRTVTAPSDGSIVAMNAQVGTDLSNMAANGSSSGPLLQIADLSKMKVTVQVGEEDIARVAVDQMSSIMFPAFEGLTLEGRVTGIASIASSGSDVMMSYDGGSSPTFAVDVLIDAPDARLKPGMTAEVSLITLKYDNVIMVPTSALQTDDGESYYVNIMTDPETQEMQRRDVTVVTQNNDYAVVGKPADAPAEENPDMAVSDLDGTETLVIAGGISADMGMTDGASAEMAVM